MTDKRIGKRKNRHSDDNNELNNDDYNMKHQKKRLKK